MTHLHFGGTYIQTIGPRLETKAEIRMLKGYGHVIGMTMASEATLSMEYGIPYASLCSIDNYCNGLVKVPLTMQQITNNVAKNIKIIEEIIEMLVARSIP
jgi:purine nucleoside phosphorylase